MTNKKSQIREYVDMKCNEKVEFDTTKGRAHGYCDLEFGHPRTIPHHSLMKSLYEVLPDAKKEEVKKTDTQTSR